MELTPINANGVVALEGCPASPLLARTEDTIRLIEACWEHEASALLLYAPNLSPRFFDLSSGEAGSILQKLQNYRVRLAVVCPPASVSLSSRFRELLAEEQHSREFGVFPDREPALAWLAPRVLQ